MRWMRWGAGAGAVLLAGLFVTLKWGDLELRRAHAEIDRLKVEREALRDYADRLSRTRRIAQINVLEQKRDDAGELRTRLRWQELSEDQRLGLPVELEISGEQLYVEAMVLKFEHQFVGSGDELKGASLALFRRVFGEAQSPETGQPIDRNTRPPRPASQAIRFEQEDRLWDRFWVLADDPLEAERFGVRVAQCEAPSVVVRPGETWEVALDSAGGINLRKLLGL